MKCQLCEGENISLFYNKGRTGPLNNFICEGCGFIFTERPSEDIYKSSQFRRKPDAWKIIQTDAWAARRYKRIANIIPGTSIDIGCGFGNVVRLLRYAGWDAIGVEADPLCIENSREDIRQEIPNNKFDLVSAFHVIEHVTDINEFLKTCKDHLKPHGVLYLELPVFNKPYGGPSHFFWEPHVNTFTQRTITAFLAKHGFVVDMYDWDGPFLALTARRGQTKIKLDHPKWLKMKLKLERLKALL